MSARVSRNGDAFFGQQGPLSGDGGVIFGADKIRGGDRVGVDSRPLARGGSVRPHFEEMNGNSVSRYRAFNVEWADIRVPAAMLDAFRVHAAGVGGPGVYDVAGKDAQGRLHRGGIRRVEIRGLEVHTGRRCRRDWGARQFKRHGARDASSANAAARSTASA